MAKKLVSWDDVALALPAVVMTKLLATFDALGAAAAVTPASIGAATPASVTAAVTALVNAAPGTMDTLGEIAAVIASDESAAAALLTSVATKATIASLTTETNRATAAEVANTGLITAEASTARAAEASKSTALTSTTVKTGAYTAAANQLVPVDATTAPITVTLPTAPVVGSRVTVKKIDASVNLVTIASAGSDVFNVTGGVVTKTLTMLNQASSYQYATGIWYAVSDDIPLSGLDARYVTPAQGSATYARPGQPLGGAAAMFGDSLANFGEGVMYYAAALSKQRMFLRDPNTYVVSHPGYASAALVPLTTEITALSPKPDFCLVIAGSNDAGSGITLTAYAANMTAIYTAFRAAGITPVICTIPPRAGALTKGRTLNTWLRRYAATNRLPLIDWYDTLVDPATGNYLAGFDNGDNTHPNVAGVIALSNATITALTPVLPPAPTVCALASGGSNLQPNSAFTVDSNADGLAEFLTATPSAGFTFSRVVDPAGFYWQRATLAAAGATKKILGRTYTAGHSTSTTLTATSIGGATSVTIAASVPAGTYFLTTATGEQDVVQVSSVTGSGPYTANLAATLAPVFAHTIGDVLDPVFSIGDRLLVAAKVRTAQSGTTAKHVFEATFYTAGQAQVVVNRILTSPASGFSQAVADGVVYTEYVVPATAVVLQLDSMVGPADGTYDTALWTVLNLTKLGLA